MGLPAARSRLGQRLRFWLLCTLPCCEWGLQVEFAPDFASYGVVHDGTTLFRSDRGVAVFMDGQWYSQQGGSLKLTSAVDCQGVDRGLGPYNGLELTWVTGQGRRFVTKAKSYESGLDVVFQTSFPEGAVSTSLVEHANASRDEVIANFPAFTFAALGETISWANSFVAPTVGPSTGPRGGPTVFFNRSDPGLRHVVVGSALDAFKASSAGPGKAWDGTPAWAPGTAGTIRELEPGFTHSFLLHVAKSGGITAAMYEWGTVLQASHQTRRSPDLTLQKLGYQTDNGAAYVFCSGNCSATLLEVAQELKSAGITLGYLSFQGSGASTATSGGAASATAARGGAPWCVNTWGPDLDGTSAYPLPVKDFQEALGLPLQLYAPYFCPGSGYFQGLNASSPWRSVVADTSLPGCADFDFQDVSPEQAYAFYSSFLARGVQAGMVSFEPDFMDQNYNCMPEFIHSTKNATIWQQGMATAALDLNVTVQWCYATPSDVLAALEMPAVTNFRVSTDFCYGRSWDVGTSSLLVWALGAAPSKDTLWTSDNGRFEVPGCPWTADHEAPAAALHLALALMSTGPVGISDLRSMANTTLIKSAIRSDGTLLKPSKALTTVDSALAGTQGKPPGFVLSTYSGETPSSIAAHHLVAFKMTQPWELTAGDVWPPLASEALHVHRTFDFGACRNGSAASTCVAPVGVAPSPLLTIPASDLTNTSGGTDFAPSIITIWPVCPSGWALLGELRRLVPTSPQRFASPACTAAGGLRFAALGLAGEVVEVTLLQPSRTGAVPPAAGSVLVLELTIPSSGFKEVELGGQEAPEPLVV